MRALKNLPPGPRGQLIQVAPAVLLGEYFGVAHTYALPSVGT